MNTKGKEMAEVEEDNEREKQEKHILQEEKNWGPEEKENEPRKDKQI
jgi:hypothetical protein